MKKKGKNFENKQKLELAKWMQVAFYRLIESFILSYMCSLIKNKIFREKEKEQRKKAPIIDLSDLEEKMKKIEEIRKKKEAERLAKKELERQEKIENQETFKYQTNEAFEVYESTLPPAVVSNGEFF